MVKISAVYRFVGMFDFTREDTLADKVGVHLNVLGPRVEDRVPH